MTHGAIAPNKFQPVTRESARRFIHIEKRDALCEIGVVGVARAQGTAKRIDFGDDMHGRFCLQVAQHPLNIAGSRESARAT